MIIILTIKFKKVQKMLISGYKKSHVFSFVAAAFVHGAIAGWSLLPSKPTVINQQAIQISFVAPSQEKQSSNNFSKKIALNVEREKSIKQKQQNQEESAENKTDKNSQTQKQTSGREDPNAIATKAAESEPVFNANYLNNPAPYYPQSAKRKGIQGKVFLSVVVKIDGTPASVEISRSSGSNDLDEAALDAVKQWKFIPARSNGKFVEAGVVVPVEFKIV
jgi:periplasmic protein TonB